MLYLAQEGRGIGLINKLRAYNLQDDGADTLEANLQLGFGADERVYQPAAEMLRQLGHSAVRLLTNNPEKMSGLEQCGIRVDRTRAAHLPLQPAQHALPGHQGAPLRAYVLAQLARRHGRDEHDQFAPTCLASLPRV